LETEEIWTWGSQLDDKVEESARQRARGLILEARDESHVIDKISLLRSKFVRLGKLFADRDEQLQPLQYKPPNTAIMGRELQKKKKRSSIPKVRQKPKSKKVNPLGNPIIAANWYVPSSPLT
jgi:hypothetical protein